MPFLKITSDKDKVITYVNIDKCSAIKADMEDDQADLTFTSDVGQVANYSFDTQEELKDYLKFLEKHITFVDDKDTTPEQKEDTSASDYDPMEAIK